MTFKTMPALEKVFVLSYQHLLTHDEYISERRLAFKCHNKTAQVELRSGRVGAPAVDADASVTLQSSAVWRRMRATQFSAACCGGVRGTSSAALCQGVTLTRVPWLSGCLTLATSRVYSDSCLGCRGMLSCCSDVHQGQHVLHGSSCGEVGMRTGGWAEACWCLLCTRKRLALSLSVCETGTIE